MKDPKTVVDELLDEATPPGKRNVINDNPSLSAAIKRFLELKAKGDKRAKHLTLNWFYMNQLRERFNGPRTMDTVRIFVRDFLKLDPATGKAL